MTAIRDQLGLTQQDFATLLGLATVSVSRWEHNRTRPTDDKRMIINLLARALEVCDGDLITETLYDLVGQSDMDRVIALVHLGDDD